jgi:hypothetical protein
MMTSEKRRQFERLLVQGVDPFQMNLDVPEFATARWTARVGKDLASVPSPVLGKHGRRLNNFCIGSDPEFVFVPGGSGHKVNACDLGLRPALAAGCDQNQRLAELRCHPTTSVVEHVSGILTCLRWMYRVVPHTREYNWRAGAWFDNDGIGGHVHFGRKRPNREMEVLGLDGVARALQATNIFPNNEWQRRQQGDAHRQIYGAFGDIRKQLHGYEYRTLPSWLCSPAKAFVVLTASKLAVMDPELSMKWSSSPLSVETGTRYLTYLARYYAGRDDDAWILKYLLTSASGMFGCPKDFKRNWGFPATAVACKPTSNILPACIEPLPEEITEITDHLLQAKPLSFVENEPTFKDTVPADYHWMYDLGVSNLSRGGVGDLCHDLVVHKTCTVALQFSDRFSISKGLWDNWTPSERREVQQMFPEWKNTTIEPYSGLRVLFDTRRDANMLTVDGIKRARKFVLKMGLMPFWTVNTVKPTSMEEWIQDRKALSKTKVKQPRIEERNL